MTVYIDLWANRMADPALLIAESVKRSIAAQNGKLAKFARQVRLQKISILKTVELDFSKPGLPDNITLSDLLIDLVRLSEKPVLLLIDEAQHALTTQQGINAMFAIKSARDQINSASKSPQLMLVLTGSNRDKLAQLVIKKDQPFFGSDVTAFPLLGRDYTDFFTDKVNESLASDNQFSKDSMWEVFQLIGHRPEILRQLAGQAAINCDAKNFSEILEQDASVWHSQIWENFENDFNTLSALQRAILRLLMEHGKAWTPFSEDSMLYYKKLIDQPALSVSSVQTAIQS